MTLRTREGQPFLTINGIQTMSAQTCSLLAQVPELLALWRDQGRASADVKRIALGHVAALERKIAELQGMVDTLRTLAAHCHGDARPDCPILTDLDAGGGR